MQNISASFPFKIKHAGREARPFLKWAGGKSQLLGQLTSFFPKGLKSRQIRRYVEPFIGSGAVFFRLIQEYPVDSYIISDINPELILVYRTVQNATEELIEILAEIEGDYLGLKHDVRKDYYYAARERFNQQRKTLDYDRFSQAWVERSGLFIFLNRTCYNGLFRINSRGEFNVPFGRYKNPRIMDANNLFAVSRLLQDVHIHFGDFETIESWVGGDTLVYFDPPYRPLSGTARFTSYSKDRFADQEQLRLADFYRRLDARGGKLMLSNSDLRNTDSQDDFFERAYNGFRIERLQAKRNINSDSKKRGPVSELLILNY